MKGSEGKKKERKKKKQTQQNLEVASYEKPLVAEVLFFPRDPTGLVSQR